MGGELGAYKIKPVLFLFAFGLLAATKTLFKRNENNIVQCWFYETSMKNLHQKCYILQMFIIINIYFIIKHCKSDPISFIMMFNKLQVDFKMS